MEELENLEDKHKHRKTSYDSTHPQTNNERFHYIKSI